MNLIGGILGVRCAGASDDLECIFEEYERESLAVRRHATRSCQLRNRNLSCNLCCVVDSTQTVT